MQRTIAAFVLAIIGIGWTGLYVKYDKDLCDGYEDLMNQASLNGKYVNLLHVIEVPEDKIIYDAFCDWGYSYCDSYADNVDLKPGFWVYVYPYWFVWERLSVEDHIDPEASAYGKYTALIHVLKVPEDVGIYGNFYDWGFSEEYDYAGYENLTPGYWVYQKPNWYVWADMKNNTGGT
jgi:hypothetical protein